MKYTQATYHQNKSGRLPLLMIVAAALAQPLSTSLAEITTYHSRSAFEAAVSQPLFTEDFGGFASDTDLFAEPVLIPGIGISLKASSDGLNTARHLIDVPPYRFAGGGVDSPDVSGTFVWTFPVVEDNAGLTLTSMGGAGAPSAIGFDYSGATGAPLTVTLEAACRVTTANGGELLIDFPIDDGFIGFFDPDSPIVSIEILDRTTPDGQPFRNGERMAIDNITASLADTDSDGMHDLFEVSHGLAKNVDDAALDPDIDGLDNLTEFQRGTDPQNPDTDGDGLGDGVESESGVFIDTGDAGTNPREADSDFDGLTDDDEVSRATNPNDADSDNDGKLDGFEVAQGSDPNDANSTPSGFAEGLVSYWPGDGHTRDAVNDNHASAFEGAIPFVEGKFAEAISVTEDWSRCYADQGDESEFDFPGQSMSVSVWFRDLPIGRNTRTLVGKGPRGAWRLQLISGSLTFSAGFSVVADAEAVVDDGQWHHAVAVAEEGVATRLYLDGVLVAEGAAPNMEDGALRLHIGANPDDGMYDWWQRWNGDIDDVAVWGRTLQEDEVSAIWNDGSGASIGELLVPVPLAITEFSVDQAGGEFSLTWRSGIGKSYALEFSTDLVSWEEAEDSLESQGEFTTYAGDITAEPGAQRVYFRVREEGR